MRYAALVRPSFFMFWLASVVLAYPQAGLSWGERGHDLIARLAVRQLVQQDSTRYGWLSPKEHMFGHLANVPDIVWRNMDRRISRLNGPTHYIDLDLLSPTPTPAAIPAGYLEARTLAQKRGHDIARDVGTAPWRIEQLWALAVADLRSAKTAQAKASDKDFKQHVTKALTYLGIMSHFVGDLAQPLHTVKDYDGYESGHGGLHSYFESAIVSALPLTIDARIAQAAAKRPFLDRVPKNAATLSPSSWAIILACDSFDQLGNLLAIDQKHSMQKPSKTEPIKIESQRSSPSAAAPHYEDFVVARLAIGIDAFAFMLEQAIAAAGSPNLSSYFSFDYDVKPDFIEPLYALDKN